MSRSRRIVSCLVGFLVCLGLQPEALFGQQAMSLGHELRMPDGTPYFLGEMGLREALAQESTSRLNEAGIYTKEQAGRESIASLIERSHDKTQVDEDGCVEPYFFEHRESEYLRHPDSFEDVESLNLQTPVDLSYAAPEIAIVRVQATESGVMGARLGTLVQFEVEEWIKKDPGRDEFGEASFLFSSDFWIELGGRTYCLRRAGVRPPSSGDQLVVFGYRHPTGKFFRTGNIFRLDGGVILPRPYPSMDEAFPVSLQQLKDAVESGHP